MEVYFYIHFRRFLVASAAPILDSQCVSPVSLNSSEYLHIDFGKDGRINYFLPKQSQEDNFNNSHTNDNTEHYL